MFKLKIGSDFTGVGAFNQALNRLGIDYEEVFACDQDKFARQTFVHNYGEPKYFPKDVYERDIPDEPLDVYMTSPPCQAFSMAGNRAGEDDDRGILFYNSHEFIQLNNPRYFIFENVKGLLSASKGTVFKKWIDYLGGKSVNGEPTENPHPSAVPYHIHYKVLNAKNYGIPQNRERVFIVGIRDDADNNFTWPNEIPLTRRLKDVLEPEVNEKYYLSEACVSRLVHTRTGYKSTVKNGDDIAATVLASINKLPRGMNVIAVNPNTKQGYELARVGQDSVCFGRLGNKTRRGRVGKDLVNTLTVQCEHAVFLQDDNKSNISVAGTLTGGKWDKTFEQSRRVYGTEGLSPTISTMQGGGQVPKILQINTSKESGGKQPYQQNRVYNSAGISVALCKDKSDINIMHDYNVRKLTPRESFRLMDFPDSFTWPVSDSQAYKQAGNSICVGVLAGIILGLDIPELSLM